MGVAVICPNCKKAVNSDEVGETVTCPDCEYMYKKPAAGGVGEKLEAEAAGEKKKK